MSRQVEIKNRDNIKKQTLVVAVLVSLFIGFMGGSFYSSFKLAADQPGGVQKGNINQAGSQADVRQENSIEFSAKILQLEQYLKKHPEDGNAWTRIGHLFFDSNQVKNAIEAYHKSLAIIPGDTGVITDLGVMYRRDNQPEKAIEMFNKAISIDPSFETARFNKGIVLLHDLNDVAGGIKAWQEIVDQNPMAVTPNGESLAALIRRMQKQIK